MLQRRVFGGRMRHLAGPVALVALMASTGCAEIVVGVEVAKRANRALGEFQLAQAQTAPAPQPAAVSPYLAPAPEIFEATGQAVWDGKRTLQGVWVAHPLAKTARRVRIFNESNGQAVDGALFKRDTTQGSNSILLSSEAAQLLGMSPGDRVSLRIVAVTPVRDPQPVPSPSLPPPATAATPAPEQPVVRAEPEPEPAQPELPAPQPAPAAVPEPQVAAAPAPQPTPAARPATPGPEREAEPKEEITFRWEGAPTDPEAAQPAAPSPTAAPAAQLQVSDLAKPYVQAGIFGVPGNASRLVRKLEGMGIPATGRQLTSGGRQLTRVIAGPFQTRDERDAAQQKIRRLGLRDAVPVRR